eukprot:7412931-Prorocentrum_lima.AAC.1
MQKATTKPSHLPAIRFPGLSSREWRIEGTRRLRAASVLKEHEFEWRQALLDISRAARHPDKGECII